MAKSARSSSIKKNNQKLKKKVFGPVETARNERQSAKLLELAQQPKPLRAEMEVEKDEVASEEKGDKAAEAADVTMDVDGATTTTKSGPRSNRLLERIRHGKGKSVEKRHRKATNNIVFKRHPLKPGKKTKR